MQFGDSVAINPAILVGLVQNEPETYRLKGSTLRVHAELESPELRFSTLEELVESAVRRCSAGPECGRELGKFL